MENRTDERLGSQQAEGRPAAAGSALRPMVLSLIQSSYAQTQTFAEFAHDVFDIVGAAVTVPVAFAEGFLRSFVSIESVDEDESGRVVIRPKPGASEEEIIREVDEIAARVDPSAIYNPVVRRQMDMVANASDAVMRQDLEALASLTPDELHDALADLEPPDLTASERIAETDAIRERLEKVRYALRRYQRDEPHQPPAR